MGIDMPESFVTVTQRRDDQLIGIAIGVFVGNFLFHVIQGSYSKGLVVGGVAAGIVLVLYVIRKIFRKDDDKMLARLRHH